MAIIIGSGAGSGLLAMKLVKAGIPTTILETGHYLEPKESFDYYIENTENKEVLVSKKNIPKELEDELKSNGISLSKEFGEIDGLITYEIDESKIGEATQKFIDEASNTLNVTKVEKAVDGFGNEFLQGGTDYALTIIKDLEDVEIIAENGNIVGVKYVKDGHERIRYTKTVILSTDAITSSLLLKNAGIEAGKDITYESYAIVQGTVKDINIDNDIPLVAVANGNGFKLTPCFAKNEENKTIFGIVVKSDDKKQGTLDENGKLSVNADGLDTGIEAAKSILESLKAKEITVSEAKAMKAIGGANIGDIVNNDLETKIKGLFVCDSSILPVAPEYPPVASILALSNKLANYLENIDYDNNQYGKSDYGLGKSYGKMDGWWRESPKE